MAKTLAINLKEGNEILEGKKISLVMGRGKKNTETCQYGEHSLT